MQPPSAPMRAQASRLTGGKLVSQKAKLFVAAGNVSLAVNQIETLLRHRSPHRKTRAGDALAWKDRVAEHNRIVSIKKDSASNRALLTLLIIILGMIAIVIIFVFPNPEHNYGNSPQMIARVNPEMQEWAERFPSDFLAAERSSNDLAVQYPTDPSAYRSRADTSEKLGDIPGALTDMRTALSLLPDPSHVALSVYYDLARLEGKIGQYCEAVATLRDYIAYDPKNRRTQQLTTVMQNWQQQGSCAPSSGTGSAFLHYDPRSDAIIVPVKVNGLPAKMILDTGASRTALTQSLAAKTGIEASAPEGAIVTTANGTKWIPGGRARSLSLGEAHLDDVPIFISPGRSFGAGVDGLLGLSFLGNFRVRVGGGTLQVRPLQ
jgi:clan AA aspartic protease (TIGR02281 family)